MVKAVIKLKNGTEVSIDGTTEEVRSLLNYYDSNTPTTQNPSEKTSLKGKKKKASSKHTKPKDESSAINISEIVNLAKDCDEAEMIETQILDRSSQVDRVLLPIYIVHKYLNNAFGLSSGDIAQITRDLGVPISQPNASRVLSGIASKYVISDGVRKKGTKLSYKLSRRGTKYLNEVISGISDEK